MKYIIGMKNLRPQHVYIIHFMSAFYFFGQVRFTIVRIVGITIKNMILTLQSHMTSREIRSEFVKF